MLCLAERENAFSGDEDANSERVFCFTCQFYLAIVRIYLGFVVHFVVLLLHEILKVFHIN